MLCNRLVKYESSIGGVSLKAILSENDGEYAFFFSVYNANSILKLLLLSKQNKIINVQNNIYKNYIQSHNF